MDFLTAFLVAVAVVYFLVKIFPHPDRKRLPPGPRGLPVLGSAFSIPPRDYLHFEQLRGVFGDVVLVRLGSYRFVYLSSARAIRAALTEQADVFSGRIRSEYGDALTGSAGIIFQDGPGWLEHRRFTLRALRDLGLGRAASEETTLQEAERFLRSVPLGEAVDVMPLFSRCINNVISHLTLGERCGSDDPDFREFHARLSAFFGRSQSITSLVPLLFPALMKVPLLNRAIERLSGMREITEFVHAFMRRKIAEHAAALPDGAPGSVCDALLTEQRRRAGQNHSFSPQQLVRDLVELFIAGTDTTALSLTWAVFLLATHADVQRRLQAEIDAAVDRGRSVTMRDRPRLPFVLATVDEVLRFSSILPTGLPHRCRTDTHLLGFFIPEDTVVVTNLYAVHRDPALWERPHRFFPEHFLAPDGSYRPSDNLMAFSLGRRACIGESLARMELFLFLVSVFQQVSVRLADDACDVAAVMAGTDGPQRRLLPHEVVFSARAD